MEDSAAHAKAETKAAAPRLVLFGAGMTGRGQVAQLADEAGWQLTLVDRNPELIELLRSRGAYQVLLLGETPRSVTIRGFQALHITETPALHAAIRQADLVVTSVLEPNLPAVGQVLAAALAERLQAGVEAPLNIIAAENMDHSSSDLKGYVRQHLPAALLPDFERLIGFPNSMISRVVPIAADPLQIVTEAYSEWTADRQQAAGEPPRLQGLEWVDNQTARLQRKLYLHNGGHVICGYLGWLGGYQYIHEAAQDAAIMPRIRQAISEAGEAISRQHGFARAEVKTYEEHLLGRLVISALADDLRRVIRHPIRKLGPEERLLGPLRLCETLDLPRAGLCCGVAAVLAGCRLVSSGGRTLDAGDLAQFERVHQAVERLGPAGALEELVGFRPNPASAQYILEAYEALKA